jgi:hypothetical protein
VWSRVIRGGRGGRGGAERHADRAARRLLLAHWWCEGDGDSVEELSGAAGLGWRGRAALSMAASRAMLRFGEGNETRSEEGGLWGWGRVARLVREGPRDSSEADLVARLDRWMPHWRRRGPLWRLRTDAQGAHMVDSAQMDPLRKEARDVDASHHDALQRSTAQVAWQKSVARGKWGFVLQWTTLLAVGEPAEPLVAFVRDGRPDHVGAVPWRVVADAAYACLTADETRPWEPAGGTEPFSASAWKRGVARTLAPSHENPAPWTQRLEEDAAHLGTPYAVAWAARLLQPSLRAGSPLRAAADALSSAQLLAATRRALGDARAEPLPAPPPSSPTVRTHVAHTRHLRVAPLGDPFEVTVREFATAEPSFFDIEPDDASSDDSLPAVEHDSDGDGQRTVRTRSGQKYVMKRDLAL